MHEDDGRILHQLVESYAEMLTAIRTAGLARQQAYEQYEAALGRAMEANRAAMQLLRRLMDEGPQS
jgi:hypothetical protein